jgi:hypothetical protein
LSSASTWGSWEGTARKMKTVCCIRGAAQPLFWLGDVGGMGPKISHFQ